MEDVNNLFKQIDRILNYLNSHDNIYIFVKDVERHTKVKTGEALSMLELLADEGYVIKVLHITDYDKSEGVTEPKEYWKITIKGRLLIDNGGYVGLISKNRTEKILKYSLMFGSWIVATYALIRLVTDFLIPFLKYVYGY
ncbi:MAG: hypothetical protein ACJASQ_002724 [Crocinitomicaceae bacterium]|jgi:hypothetical protein